MHLRGVVERHDVERVVVGPEVERDDAATYSWTRARWVIIAALGRDVVPDV